MRKRLVPLIQLAIGVTLLVVISSNLDWQILEQHVSRLRWQSIIPFFFILLVIHTLKALQWGVILRAWRVILGYWTLFRWNLISLFLTNGLPGGVGGDVARVYIVHRDTGRTGAAISVVLYDRLFGIAAMVALGIVAGGIRIFTRQEAEVWPFWVLTGATIVLLVIFVIAANQTLLNGVAALSERIGLQRIIPITRAIESLRIRPERYGAFGTAFAITVLMQAMVIGSFAFVAKMLNLDIDIIDLAMFVPILFLVLVLPITINGIGLREMVFVTFFANTPVGQEGAILLSVFHFSLSVIFSMLGGLLLMCETTSGISSMFKFNNTRA